MGCYKSSRDVKMVREGEIDVPLVSSAQWSLGLGTVSRCEPLPYLLTTAEKLLWPG